MRRITLYLCLTLCLPSLPAIAKTHKDLYAMTCPALWPAVKDVLKLSGKYNIIGIDSTEMTASFTVGSVWSGKMLNSVVLNPKDTGCEFIVNTAYRGIEHNDAADFKKRIDETLAKSSPAPAAAQPAAK